MNVVTSTVNQTIILAADYGGGDDGTGGYLSSFWTKGSLIAVGLVALIWLISIVKIYGKQQGAAAKKELTESTMVAAAIIVGIGIFWTIVGIFQGALTNLTG